MVRRDCPHEEEILGALRDGRDLGGHEAHLATCRGCRQTALVGGWLRQAAAVPDSSVVLPDPAGIWWRSQVVKQLCDRDDHASRRARPLVLVHLIAVALAVTTIVGALLTSRSAAGLFQNLAVSAERVGFAAEAAMLLAAAAAASLAVGALLVWRTSDELG